MNVSPKKNFLIINLFKILFIFILFCFLLSPIDIKAKSFKDQECLKITDPFIKIKQDENNNFKYQQENINKVTEFKEVNKSSNTTPIINLDVKVKKSIIDLINNLTDKLIDVVGEKSFIFGYVIKAFKPIILFLVNNLMTQLL
ncbi:hypothetical protein [Candidatus Phytoplasma mali]|nr:hypothetical protein [Candidatus Phytoplasma mali]